MNSFIEKVKNSKELQDESDSVVLKAMNELAEKHGASFTKEDLESRFRKKYVNEELPCYFSFLTIICTSTD